MTALVLEKVNVDFPLYGTRRSLRGLKKDRTSCLGPSSLKGQRVVLKTEA